MDHGAAIFFTDYSIGPVELGRALEERGFGSLWAPEHSHIPLSRRTPFPQGGDLPKKYYDVMDPFVTLAAAAAATTRLQVATGVCLVVQRDPIQTAKAVASLDQVSGGRFLFGIGAGWNAEEMADHGTEFKTRFQVMRERVEAMKAIWTRSKPEYQGEFVNFPSDDDLAQAGAEAASAGDRGRRLSARRAPGDRLWRWLGAACAAARLWRRARAPARLPEARHGGRTRSGHGADHDLRGAGRRRPDQALS
jgi:alkanesulfonate monooxygenase SsuD/methylene tetrahydromethanopterin reductase-like flavin-dependent oxidoreductase (luciferase family)